jgi:hypothetical protein
MNGKTWKQHAASHIRWVVAQHPEVTGEKELRKLISANYPFGMRQYHPYQAWLKAVKEYFAQPPALTGLEKTYSITDYTDTPLFSEVQL